jgi:hypothetical protein
MKRWLMGLAAIVLATVIMQSMWHFTTLDALGGPAAAKTMRIGVYDPRAVALAYAHSQVFGQRLGEKQKEMEKAKAGNDQAKIKELKAWGQDAQVRLHLQGFAGAAVDDILVGVQDQLSKVAQATNVQAITLRPDYTVPDVEVVDVTDDLVKLWDPDAQTLKVIASLKKVAPLPIEQIAKMGAND